MKITKELLSKYYLNEQKTAKEISVLTGINKVTLFWYLKKFNIPRRVGHPIKGKFKIPATKLNLKKETLEQLYLDQKLTCSEIGLKLNCGRVTVYKYLKLHGIKTRSRNERTGNHIRRLSVALGGTGVPYELAEHPADFNDELKEKIRARDNYTCQECGLIEEEHLLAWGFALPVHHIDYDKSNNAENNLVSLCCQCHTRTNFNRQYWETRFKEVHKNCLIVI